MRPCLSGDLPGQGGSGATGNLASHLLPFGSGWTCAETLILSMGDRIACQHQTEAAAISITAFLGAALIGWLLADLLGGLVHWWEDRVGRPKWGWLERHVFEPNRQHHVEPMAFTEASFVSRNSTAFMASAAIAALWLFLFGPSVILLFAFLGGAFQNEVHYLTHKRPAGWLAVFQQIGIIQSVPGHAKHHLPPQNKNYCVLTDWCNPVLEYLDAWNRLERRLHITQPE